MVRGRRRADDAAGRPGRSLYYYLNVLGMGDDACCRRAVVVTAWTRSRSRSRDPLSISIGSVWIGPASAGALQDGRPPRRASAMSTYSLTHLRQLEAESIHIIREVAAEFENPVMLYSIGKDSSVMVRLAKKAFHPGQLPFPLLHVDTTWKFREMIAFRDAFCRRARARADRPHQHEGPERAGHQPDSTHGSKKYTDVMKTEALQQALEASTTSTRPSAAPAATRRRSRAKERVYSFRDQLPPVGSRRTSGPSCGTSTTARSTRARASASFRSPTGPSSTSGSTSTSRRSRSCRCTSPRSGRSSSATAR